MLVPKVNAHFSLKDLCVAFWALIKKDNMPSGKSEYYLNHARTGLRIAISALGLPKGSKIGISTYNCYTVMNAIKQAGYSIVFLDTTDNFTLDLIDLEQKKSEINALIITHLFGLPNDMEAIRKICSSIPIIEDCAHSFLSSSPEYVTGTIGDFAVFSIGLGKFPSIGDGGILRINNELYRQSVEDEIKCLKAYSLLDEVLLIVKLKLTSIIHNPFIYKWVSLPSKKKLQERKNINSNYRHEESLMAKSVCHLFHKKKNSLKTEVQKQQKNAEKFFTVLQGIKELTMPTINFKYNNCFMLPVLHSERANFAKTISRFGTEVAPHFAKSILWAEEFGYKSGSCKNAEKISKQILVVPCHYNLKNNDVQNIIKGVKFVINKKR